MSYQKKIKLYEKDWNNYPPDNAREFIKWLDALISQAPEEYRGAVEIDIYAYEEYDSAYTSIEVYYYRPETELEALQRAEDEKAEQLKEYNRLTVLLQRLKQVVGE